MYRLKVMKLNENGEVIGTELKSLSFTEYPPLDKEYSPITNVYVLPTIRMVQFENKVKRKPKRRVTIVQMCCCSCFLGADNNIEDEEVIELQYK